MENITDGEPLIRLRGGIAADPSRRLASPADFCLWRGRHAAVTGANGSGKSTLVKMITGGLYLREGSLTYSFRRTDARPYEAVRTVSFNDAYGTTESPYYYQQRWNASDRGMSPSVGGLLTGAAAASEQWRGQLFDLLDMRPLFDRELVTLSSGELRRYHITRALLTAPEAVILESPFIGLDPPTRELLCRVMERVAEHLGVTFVVTVSSASELPPMIADVYQMESMRCTGPVGRAEAVETELRTSSRRSAVQEPVLPAATHPTPLYERVVELRDATIGYGSRTIFEHLDWSVRSGEGWNVTGRNGSGKSTLLSLVCADNPRAYALDLTLFDRRRGTGESIWDIKRHIGYLSPEMHRAFADDVLRWMWWPRGCLMPSGAGAASRRSCARQHVRGWRLWVRRLWPTGASCGCRAASSGWCFWRGPLSRIPTCLFWTSRSKGLTRWCGHAPRVSLRPSAAAKTRPCCSLRTTPNCSPQR